MINKIITTVAAVLAGMSLANAGETLNGAGASFPAPVYQIWTYAYTQSQKDVKVNYQSIGSGSGIRQISEGTIDFGGTDSPLTLEEQEKSGLIQFPMLTGGVVVIFNIPGIGTNGLKLDQETLSEIFLGKITRWNDAKIVSRNKGVKLPDMEITVVHRSDSSGTTFVFTNYLSKISKDWKKLVGEGKTVSWPVGLGGQKNTGVCGTVAKTRGSIGYTEFTYASRAKLACATLKNRDGLFVEASPKSFGAAAGNADWQGAPGFCLNLADGVGAETWPITAVTYILIRKDASAEKKAELKKYFNWCFTSGAASALKLDYIPMPGNVVKLINSSVLK